MSTMKYGIVSAEQRKEMTGLEFVQGLANGTLPHNTMAGTLGYEIVEAENGRVVVTALPKDTTTGTTTAMSAETGTTTMITTGTARRVTGPTSAGRASCPSSSTRHRRS